MMNSFNRVMCKVLTGFFIVTIAIVSNAIADSPLLPDDIESTNNRSGVQSTSCVDIPSEVTIVSGGRRIGNVKQRLDTTTIKLKRIYRKRLNVNPDMGNSVCISFEITGDGTVCNIDFIEDRIQDTVMVENIIKILSETRFIKDNRSAAHTNVIYHLWLKSGLSPKQEENGKMVIGVLSVLGTSVGLLSLIMAIKNR